MNRLITLFLALSTSITLVTWSDSAIASEGWYLGLAVPYNSVGGDFKGDRFYRSSVDNILVPKVSSGLGWGAYWGQHVMPNLDWELSYLQTNHDGTFVFVFPAKDVTYSMLNFDLKYFVKTEGTPVFIQAGYGTREITLKGGSVTNSGNPIGDASYSGNGWNFGIGMNHSLNENFIFTASAVYRTASFDGGKGAAGRSKLSNPSSLDGGGIGFVVGIAYDVRHLELIRK